MPYFYPTECPPRRVRAFPRDVNRGEHLARTDIRVTNMPMVPMKVPIPESGAHGPRRKAQVTRQADPTITKRSSHMPIFTPMA